MSPTATAEPAHLRYRRDIDGLRALAVLPVVFFHFGLPGLGGGYVGVDIFFVISGYLITGVLLADINQARFSLLRFYERRVRRILPALFVVLAACGLVGLAVASPRALEELARSIIAAIFFVSNVYFWRSTSGYFDGPAETRPLLHTWSLGVEEQFYILFPIFLFVITRFGKKPAAAMLVGAFAIALAGAVVLSPLVPTASFYLAPTRAWELLLGSVLAALPLAPRAGWRAEAAAAAGLALIIGSVVLMGGEGLTPGIWAAAPCGGAALLIYAGQSERPPLGSRLLSLPPLVGIGLISYSLYLWHWPVFVFLRHYVLFQPLSPWWAACGVGAAVILAALSWKFVEQPVRKRAVLASRGWLFAAAGLAALALTGLSLAALHARGLPGRFPDLAAALMQDEPDRPGLAPYEPKKCFVESADAWGGEICRLTPGREGGPRALLWGDSHANHYAAGFLTLRASLPASVLQYTAPRCPPVLDYSAQVNRACAPFNAHALEVIDQFDIDTVILAARWESYAGARRLTPDDVGRTVAALQRRGLKVILVGQGPMFSFDFPQEYELARLRAGAKGIDETAPLAIDPTLNGRLRRAAPTAAFFDPIAQLCRGDQCYYRIGGQYVVADSGHLTRFGSERMVAQIAAMPELQGR